MPKIIRNGITYGGSGTITALDNYSTKEQVVGIWIDGKPLYQKTVRYDISSTDSTVSFPLNLASPDFIMIYDFTLIDNKTIYGHAEPYARYRIYEKSNFELKLSQTGWANGTTAYVTLRYTKTTD